MIIKASGIASLFCDGCGRRHPVTSPLKHMRAFSDRARREGWRCFFGFPSSHSRDWPAGPKRWRHSCPGCVAKFAASRREAVY